MRITVKIAVDMTPEQVEAWCDEYGIFPGIARKDVKTYALTTLQGSTLGELATVSLVA